MLIFAKPRIGINKTLLIQSNLRFITFSAAESAKSGFPAPYRVLVQVRIVRTSASAQAADKK